MYYVTDGLYCLSNQVIWQGSPFISIMQVLAVDSDDFVAVSTYSSNVMLLETRRSAGITATFMEMCYYIFSSVKKNNDSVNRLCNVQKKLLNSFGAWKNRDEQTNSFFN